MVVPHFGKLRLYRARLKLIRFTIVYISHNCVSVKKDPTRGVFLALILGTQERDFDAGKRQYHTHVLFIRPSEEVS
jgi:hypothetical protein